MSVAYPEYRQEQKSLKAADYPRVPSWLNTAVFYQIYPQSFYDSNNDGIGDIPGIIRKLDYIASLGCNAVWINPCFVSPFQDAGYDISDYYQVAPRYGTNADLRNLFKEAKERGIKVCLDLVPGHTSIEHPWFKDSCRAAGNKYSNRYIWTDNVWGKEETDLRTVNGYAERNGNFVVNHFYCQPALNYGFAKPDPNKPWQLPVDHPDVVALRDEIKKIIRYYLDMGADGFRVDMAFSLVKEDPGHEKTAEFWREVRQVLDREYPEAVLLSEWGIPSEALKAGFHADTLIHVHTRGYVSLFRKETPWSSGLGELGPSFFHKEGRGNITEFLDEYMNFYRETRDMGFIAIPTGNHDMCRISRGRSSREIELVFVFILTMPGVPFIYYGDEIGMKYRPELVSKEGGYNRTGSRTPMQWDSSPNSGFSAAQPELLYLPVDGDPNRPTVEAQESDRSSLLNRVRVLATIHKENPALRASADFQPVYANPGQYPFIYLRTHRTQKILVCINPSKKPVKVRFNLSGLETAGGWLVNSGARLKKDRAGFLIAMHGLSYGIYSELEK